MKGLCGCMRCVRQRHRRAMTKEDQSLSQGQTSAASLHTCPVCPVQGTVSERSSTITIAQLTKRDTAPTQMKVFALHLYNTFSSVYFHATN